MKERPIEFYLDAFELLNKPRRIFQGLIMQVEQTTDNYTDEEIELTKEIIKEACLDFYAVTLPKFEERIKKTHDN